MKLSRQVLPILLWKAAFWVVVFLPALTSKATDGFSMAKIRSHLSYHPEWEVEQIFDLDKAVHQSYFYLDHGAQSYVFASSDGQYVLKFFRHHHARHPLEKISFLLPPEQKKRLLATVKKRREKREKDFTSTVLAFNELREETGLLYLHLNKTNHLNHTLTFYDKIGIEHRVPLDEMEFVIQKRATPFYAQLEEWIENKEQEEAKQALKKITNLLRIRCEKGIGDKNPDLKTNFGWLEDRPIQFDVGRFRKLEEREESIQNELIRITDRLKKWLEEKDPALASYLEQEVRG